MGEKIDFFSDIIVRANEKLFDCQCRQWNDWLKLDRKSSFYTCLS